MVKLPRIIAHRGSPKVAPENTLASFRQAAKEGARWVEFDVSLTADGRVVVFHDDDLDRTSDGAGPLAHAAFETIKNLNAGSWFSPAFAGEMVPTLEEALELFAELGLSFNMELKVDPGREVELAAAAVPIARECWKNREPHPLISSFSRRAVAAAKDLAPQWPRSFLFDRLPDDWEQTAEALGVTTLNGNHRHLTRDAIAAMRQRGYGVLAYTVNDRGRATELFDWGLDAIFTDVPGEMLRAFPEYS